MSEFSHRRKPAGWLFLAMLGLIGCGSENPEPGTSRTSLDVELRCGTQATPQAAADIKFQLAKTHSGEDTIEIVTTIGMVTDIVRQVAGSRANVTGLMKEGVDPHLYQPTRDDNNAIKEADVIFYSGLQLETSRMQQEFDRQEKNGVPVFAVTDGISQAYFHKPPEFEGHYDPHVWGNPAAWSLCAGYVGQALAAYDPDHAEEYQANTKAYQAKLAELSKYAKDAMASIPKEKRVLITAHDAFGYFSCAFEIPVKSAQGVSTESEAGVNDVINLVELIVQRKIQAIFVESSVNPKTMTAIKEGVTKQGHSVAIGGELFSDAMGPAGTYEGTYIGMIDHNATTIARALGGKVPERGMQGLLKSE